jgi:molecular chaperone DnaJ
MKDYYGILGLGRDASQDDIKRAYRSKARLHHPDVSQEDEGAEARFKEIGEAYEVLSDPEKRRRYDLFGEAGTASSSFERGFDNFGGPFGDIFNLFFGRGQARASRTPSRGSDLLATVRITLSEAYHGTTRELEIPRRNACDACGGTGIEKGYGRDLCPDCGGEGRESHTRRSAFGSFTSSTTCRRCGGAGEINTHPCQVCEGRGSLQITDKVEVNIPAGIDNGDRMRLGEHGEAGYLGGPPGDLYVEINVDEHETFTRQGSDLYAFVSVDMVEAALGTNIEVPTMNGEEKLHIPAGSQPGEIFRLRGKGMPRIRSRASGDIYLTLDVRVPRKLDADQKKLLKEFRRIESERGEPHGIADRLRKAVRPQH